MTQIGSSHVLVRSVLSRKKAPPYVKFCSLLWTV